MSNKTLSVLISTHNERIKQLANILPMHNSDVQYIVIHQVNNHEDYSFWVEKNILTRQDVQYFMLNSRGVTKSRNFALSKANSDYALFMDDDVKLAENFYSEIIASFEKYPEVSVLTFRAASIETKEPLKKYLIKEQRHSKLSILKVGTIEIAFNVKAVQSVGVTFPEYLGAGTKLPASDEPVFLARLMSKGLQLMFIPKTIVFHPQLSSGKTFVDENTLICRGVAFKEIFGRILSIPVIVFFYLKNRQRFKLDKHSALFALFKGYNMTNFE